MTFCTVMACSRPKNADSRSRVRARRRRPACGSRKYMASTPSAPPRSRRFMPARASKLWTGGQPCEVVGERLEVLLRHGFRRGGHVAVHVGARARLEALQLDAQVRVLLAGEARNVLLAEQARPVALRAVVFPG